MTALFTNPDKAAGKFKLADHLGALVIIEPTRVDEQVSTQYGAADALAATIHVIDGEHGDTTYTDVRLFQKGLVSQLRARIGQKVLARIGQGTAGEGFSAPWQLDDPTETDAAIAAEWWEDRQQSAHADTWSH